MKIKKIIKRWLMSFLGGRPIIGLYYLPRYILGFMQYKKLSSNEKISVTDSYPCLTDWSPFTPFDPHYFYQGAWLMRELVGRRTINHVDIASSVTTIANVSAVIDTIFVDYRPLNVRLKGLDSICADILNLPFPDDSVASLSCMHVIEHIGLGRYGDKMDKDGTVKAAQDLQRIMAKGGCLFLTVPVGRERVEFNAHRVHSPTTILRMFSQLKLEKFSYVNDSGTFIDGCDITEAESESYACGMFVFQKNV